MTRKNVRARAKGSTVPVASGTAGEGDPPFNELIQQGYRAVEEYDYELARAVLTRAFELSGGAEAAAEALLVFLVDHLAADHEALEFGDRLSREAQGSQRVQLALALAAARSGARQRAQEHLARLDGTAAAEVLVLLAEAALDAGELEEAARLCDRARSHDSAHPGIQQVARRLAQAREDVRRPLEAAISEKLADGKIEEARQLAEQLLARFPESAVARRVVRTALEQQRTNEAERLVKEAEAALAQGDLGVVRSALRVAQAAAAAAPPHEQLALRLAAVESQVRARELDAQVSEAVERLASTDRRAALTYYGWLAPDVRRRVREAAGVQVLDDLEHVLHRRADPGDAVAAVVALDEAALCADVDPHGALEKLAAHERALAGLDSASRLAIQLRLRIREERRRQLSDLLAAARRALSAGDPAAALELLEKEALRGLEPGDRESFEALRTEAKVSLETRDLEASYERLLQAGDPLAARVVAEQLVARAGETERATRQEQVAVAREAARRAFGVWVSQAGDDTVEGPHTRHFVETGVPLNISDGSALDPEGRSLVLLECCHRWLFVQVVDLEVGRVRTRAILRAPKRLARPKTLISPTNTLIVASMEGVLEISLETWEPLLWRSSHALALDGISLSIEIAPDGRFVWTLARRSVDTPGRIRAVDLARERVVREMLDGERFWPLVGASEPTMAYTRRGTVLSLHHPGGTPVEDGRIEFPAYVQHALVHPGQGRLLVFVGNDERLGFVEVDAAGRTSAPQWLDGTNSRRSLCYATSLAERMSFVVTHGDDGQNSLYALRAEQPSAEIQQVYRAPIPKSVILARNSSSRHIIALVADHERVHVAPLGPEPPVFAICEREEAELDFLSTPGFNSGCTFARTIEEDQLAAVREVRSYSERAATAWMQRQLEGADADVAEVLYTYHVLRDASRSTQVESLLQWMQENLPSDPHTALLHAVEYAHAEEWAGVRRSLETVDLEALFPEYRQHAYHLFGLALLREGETERAIAAIEAGRQQPKKGWCQLDGLLELIRPLSLAIDHDEYPNSPLSLMRSIIRETDARLLRDDLAGAREVIDRSFVWQNGEVQSLARLAEVELRSDPDGDAGRFRKALALARFLEAHRMFAAVRKELPLLDAGWPASRIADLEMRAQAWLDRIGTPETPADTVSPPGAESAPADTTPPVWSLMLRELDEALEAIEGEESAKAPARLAFRVRHAGHRFEGIDVLLQRRLRTGRFSAGQVADAGDLLAAAGMLADDADAAAVVVLTEGVPQAPRTRPAPSRARMLRLLATLVGHPRVFLPDQMAEPAQVQSECLGLELVDAPGGLAPRFVLGGARWTADELLAHVDSSLVIDVDAAARVVTLAPLGAAALALVQALVRHQPVFPEESHDELRRRLGALQHGIELRLPERLAGAACESDSRPVVRLTPEGDTGLLVEVGVRPVPGAIFGAPGEGSRLALGAVDGRRVAARRDLPAERASAERLVARLALDGATQEGRWRHRLNGEERVLAVVEAIAELGAEVVVEWPKDARAWRWLGRATSKELRVHIARTRDLLSIEGGVELDGHRIALAALLEAIARGRRYVLVGADTFVAISAELRERLEAAEGLIHAGRGGLEAALSAAPVLADLEDELSDADAGWRALRERTAAARTLEPELPAGLRAELRPYQLEGFRWLARLSEWAAGACLADDMGLGKTVQALALLVHRAALGPALVVAPISVTPNWISEAARFAPGLRVRPYRGANREALLADAGPGDLFVAGYGVVTRDADALARVRFSTLALDEAHSIKNAATRRARAVAQIQADFRVALTGTPVENHLGELWSLFRVVSPGLLGTWAQFRERFAVPIERDQRADRRAALARVLRPFMLRRTKETVLPELPPRTEIERLVSLSASERELYETTRLAAATALADTQTANNRLAVLAWLTRLRQLSCHPRLYNAAWTGAASKLDAFLAIVDELRATGHRALVFSQFTGHLALVREAVVARGISIVYLDGDMPVDERARAVEVFQRGTADLFLISLKAGGTGLNLTAADHVIHLDPWWNPAVEDQATDRAHRIGQARPVTVIRLIAQGTIEEAVLALHAEKRELAERLLEGSDVVGRLSAAELVELVRRGATDSDLGDEDERESGPDLGGVVVMNFDGR